MSLKVKQKPDGITIECRVTPRASKSAVKGEKDGVLLVALNSPPVDGRANEELIEVMAKYTGMPRSRITILQGEHSRNKVVFIQGAISPSFVRRGKGR